MLRGYSHVKTPHDYLFRIPKILPFQFLFIFIWFIIFQFYSIQTTPNLRPLFSKIKILIFRSGPLTQPIYCIFIYYKRIIIVVLLEIEKKFKVIVENRDNQMIFNKFQIKILLIFNYKIILLKINRIIKWDILIKQMNIVV